MIQKLFWLPQWLIKHPRAWFCFIGFIIPTILFLDRYLTTSTQILPAIFLSWLLVGALSTRSRHDQVLLALFVAIATCFEIMGSLVLQWYTYRLHNIPLWIPPGHGVIFLSAILWSRHMFACKQTSLLKHLVSAGAILYGIYGLLSPRHDIAGAVFGGLFLVWLWGISADKTRFYTALWVAVCYLEICGVALGTWSWANNMPLTGLSQGNPPSGIVGAYGGFDLVAFGLMALAVELRRLRNAGLGAGQAKAKRAAFADF